MFKEFILVNDQFFKFNDQFQTDFLNEKNLSAGDGLDLISK
jgi:hypothetical protein